MEKQTHHMNLCRRLEEIGVGLLLAMVVLASWPVRAAVRSKTVEKTFPFVSDGTIVLKTGNARVRVVGWDSAEVALKIVEKANDSSLLRAEQALQAVEITTHLEKTHFVLEARLPQGNFNLLDVFTSKFWKQKIQRVNVRFDLKIPAKSTLKIDGEDKPVSVQGVRGEIQISLDDGTIRLKNCESPFLTLETNAGRIEVENATTAKGSGSLLFSSGQGDVMVRNGRFDKLTGQTKSGDVLVLHAAVQTLDISTGGGNVESILEWVQSPVWRITNHLGDVVLVLAPGISAHLDASADEGQIWADPGWPVERESEGTSCKTVLKGGNGKISVHAHEGDIYLHMGDQTGGRL